MNSLVKPQRIRAIAIGLIWKGDHLLVEHGFDSSKRQYFYRPPGGAIEFGEHAVEALRREFREEMNAGLVEPRLVIVTENLFQFEDQPGHEVVFVFEARFEDRRLYEREEFVIQEAEVRTVASWKSLQELAAGDRPLYPDGLLQVLSPTAG